jgi:hypothetical protein
MPGQGTELQRRMIRGVSARPGSAHGKAPGKFEI